MFKSDLAALYAPHITPRAAQAHLRRLIATTPGLRAALEASGFTTHQQRLTPRQVDIFYQFLGRPADAPS